MVNIRELRDKETRELFYPKTHVSAVVGLSDQTFFEMVEVDGYRTVKLKDEYAGLWTPGWIADGGVGPGGGSGGLITSVKGVSALGTPIATESLTETFSAKAVESIYEAVVALQNSTPNVSLANGANYSTLSVNGTAADFYTKAQVDNLLLGIHPFEPVSVATLPVATANTMFQLYLVPSSDPQAQDANEEYITVRNGSDGNYTYSWERIGSTQIDLTGYVTTTALAGWSGSANITTLGTIASGSIPLSLVSGASNLSAIEALSGTSGFLKKTAANTWALDTASYLPLTGGTLTGALTMSGANIMPSTDDTCTIGNSDARLNAGSIRNIYTTYLAFIDGTTKATRGNFSIAESYAQIYIAGNNAKSYMFYDTSGFFANGGGVPCGLSNHRWSKLWSVDADLSGNLSLSGNSHIDIGPLRIEYDDTNKAIHITKVDANDTNNYGIYADGFIGDGGIQ